MRPLCQVCFLLFNSEELRERRIRSGRSTKLREVILHWCFGGSIHVDWYVRQNKGYTFNCDDCVDKQIICCKEFRLDVSDNHTMEVLKDILSGNAATVKVKNQPPAYLKPMPWLFISNHHNFHRDNIPYNSWPARLYQYEFQVYSG